MDRPATELDLYRELEGERALSDQLADALVLVRLGMHQVGAGKGNILFDAVNNALASYNKARGK